MAKPEQVQDEGFRTLLLQARSAFLDRKGTASVHSSVEALLRLMQQQPDLIQLKRAPGVAVRVGRVWPNLGVKVEQDDGQPIRVLYEREHYSLSEAITFYEFALESLIAAKL